MRTDRQSYSRYQPGCICAIAVKMSSPLQQILANCPQTVSLRKILASDTAAILAQGLWSDSHSIHGMRLLSQTFLED